MESIVLIYKGLSLATTIAKFYQTKNVERLVEENTKRVSDVSSRLSMQESANFLDALKLLEESKSAPIERQSFYLENAYLKFLHSYNYYKSICDEILSFDKVEDGILLIDKNPRDKRKQKEFDICWKNIQSALNGCYITSYYLKNYNACLDYLDLLMSSTYIYFTIHVLNRFMKLEDINDYPQFIRFMDDFRTQMMNERFWIGAEEVLPIYRNMVELLVDCNLSLTKVHKHLVFAHKCYKFTEWDLQEDSWYFDDIKYILDHKSALVLPSDYTN